MKFILFAYLQEHDILQRTYHRWTRANMSGSVLFCYPPLIYPPRLNLYLLCRLSFMGRRLFYPYMKIIDAFYENHSFYVCRFLWYTKTISEGFRYISLRVP